MAIIEKDSFKFYDNKKYDEIFIEDKRLLECIKYINNTNIKKISINSLFYKLSDIDFLRNCVDIEKVLICCDKIIDFSGLYSLKNLTSLLINEINPNALIDFSKLTELKDLYLEWNKNVKNLSKCRNLIKLGIWKYKPKTKDLSDLEELTNLKELIITQGNIESLKGLRVLKKLVKLEINYLRNLRVLNELEYISDNLRHLRFESCKNIINHEYVTCLKNLELLAFDNCGNIQSLKFIKEFPRLKSFIFVGTNIVDGDISYCKGLDYVAYDNKKHFNMKYEDFEKINKDITRIEITI